MIKSLINQLHAIYLKISNLFDSDSNIVRNDSWLVLAIVVGVWALYELTTHKWRK